MKVLVQRISSNPTYAKALEWGKLVTITSVAQITIQALGLISGIIVIRLLSTREYALYTLANTMLGTITLVADGGVATGVMAQGGKVWQSHKMLGAAIATGLDLRKKFATIVLIIAIPTLIFLLHHHEASWLMSIIIVVSLVPTFLTALSGTLLEIAPRLHQDITSLQKVEVGANIGRLLMIGATLFVFPWAFVAILGAGLPQIWANKRLRKISAVYSDWTQKPDPVIRKQILPIVKRVLPGALYYCVSGQITIWLISIYGSTEAIAQVGALGRLTMVLNLFNIVFSTLVVPRFARLPNNRKLIFARFLQAQAILIILSAVVITFIFIFPLQALSLLGKNYSHLTTEITLITVGSCVSLAAGITYSISVSRGWILAPLVNIGGNVITQIILLYTLDLSNIKNVLLFSIINSSVAYLMLVIYFVVKCFQQKSIKSL
jgi:O-antigen/teichoic acid export membrane protein